MKPLLVGEQNPYGADPKFALYPYPENSGGERPAIVLLGAKVVRALNFTAYTPFLWIRATWLVILPHPSGLSRAWNEPGAYERARAVLREAGVL